MNDHALFTLLAIAEVSATFAGFSGVVAVFGRRAHGEWFPEDRFRLTNMLMMSLGSGLFALVPILEELLHVPDRALFTTASALLGAFSLAYLIVGVARTRRLRREHPGALARWAVVVIQASLFLAAALQALNAFGILYNHEAGPYLAGLLLLLVFAGIQFAFLVLVPPREGPRRDEPPHVKEAPRKKGRA
ncbi:MAG: hypothetical protein HY049_04675 [Acidobacteria bacterium]|nr:hypothetical protein [Acidobacteriota bacterium]